MLSMPEIVTGSVLMRLIGRSVSSSGAADTESTLLVEVDEEYANGTSDDQTDTLLALSGDLAAAGSVDINMKDGSVEQPLGFPAELEDAILVLVQNTGTGDLLLEGNFLDLSSESIPIQPGGFILLHCGTVGQTVVASTGDTVTLYSVAGTSYKFSVLGRSA